MGAIEEPVSSSVGSVKQARLDARAYLPTYAENRKSIGVRREELVGSFQVGSHLVYRAINIRDPKADYVPAVQGVVLDGLLEILSHAGGYVHPGPADRTLDLAEIRKLAVENPQIQVSPAGIGFWVPWSALAGAKTLREM